jgi:hypothetical protein
VKLLVCGSRDIDHAYAYELIRDWIVDNGTVTSVVQGGCRGADRAAQNVARNLKLPCDTFSADWRLGKKAGPVRNEKMIRDAKPDYCLALCNQIDLRDSRGTFDCVTRCRTHGVTVTVLDAMKWQT